MLAARARGRPGRRARRARRRSAASPRSAESMSPTIMSGLKPCLEDRVGAAVDADEHRLTSRMYGRSALQVALVVDAADDDQRRAVAEVGVEARQLDPPGQQLALLDHVLDGVLRERLERLADLRAGAASVARGDGARAPAARRARATLAAARTTSPPRSVDRVAVAQTRRTAASSGSVDQRDAGLDEQQRPHVRVARRSTTARQLTHAVDAARRSGPRPRRGRGRGGR